ncbi:MAG: class II glutamine amidotransferase [Methanosphaera sp.]|nr:class II glutamine amidotransferase [Methanosphaera sp.]
MCELFGVSSRKRVIINDYLKKFYSHSDEHPHGWGLALKEDNKISIEKQPVKASESEYLKQLLENEIIVDHAFAHIRLATIGLTNLYNCHPFSKKDNYERTWTLIHNGTIFKYEPLDYYIKLQTGETDSERILLYVVDKINEEQNDKKRQLTSKECFHLIDSITSELSENNKLNYMLFNCEILFVHANYKDSLYYLQSEDSFFISTRPLSDEKWKLLPINRVYGIKEEKIIYYGIQHKHEYELTEENYNLIIKQLSPELRQNIKIDFDDSNYIKEYKSGSKLE